MPKKRYPTSILLHPEWDRIRSMLRLEYYKDEGRNRIEVRRDLPEKDLRWLSKVVVQCSKCGAPMNPFRSRKGRSGMFYAASCKLVDNTACSRSAAASQEYGEVENQIA